MRPSLPSRAVLAAAIAMLAATVLNVDSAAAQSPKQHHYQPIAPDPVGSAIVEASRRFGVPEHWIRSVMHVESAGNARAVSHAGAMGLMQVMPATYTELRRRYGFGPDPFDVRDNVLAGAAYLREMFDRYGSQGMLAAYNAGPRRWEEHLRGARRLPRETVDYLARLGPAVGVNSATAPVPSALVAGSGAPRPSLFVQLARNSTATETLVGKPPATPMNSSSSPASERTESVFVGRMADVPATSDRSPTNAAPTDQIATAAPVAAPMNPLFVSVSTAPDHP